MSWELKKSNEVSENKKLTGPSPLFTHDTRKNNDDSSESNSISMKSNQESPNPLQKFGPRSLNSSAANIN